MIHWEVSKEEKESSSSSSSCNLNFLTWNLTLGSFPLQGQIPTSGASPACLPFQAGSILNDKTASTQLPLWAYLFQSETLSTGAVSGMALQAVESAWCGL